LFALRYGHLPTFNWRDLVAIKSLLAYDGRNTQVKCGTTITGRTGCHLLLLKQFLSSLLQLAGDAVGDGGENLGQVELNLHRIYMNVQPTGQFLTEARAFEVQAIALPALLKREHRAKPACHLLPQLAEAFLDPPPGLVFAQ